MSGKRRHSSPRQPDRGLARDEDGDLASIFFNPVYGYGKCLEPRDYVVDQVFKRVVELAWVQQRLGRAPTLAELEREFTALMEELVANGSCWHVQDVPPLVPKETWLRAQQEAIGRLAAGEDL